MSKFRQWLIKKLCGNDKIFCEFILNQSPKNINIIETHYPIEHLFTYFNIPKLYATDDIEEEAFNKLTEEMANHIKPFIKLNVERSEGSIQYEAELQVVDINHPARY